MTIEPIVDTVTSSKQDHDEQDVHNVKTREAVFNTTLTMFMAWARPYDINIVFTKWTGCSGPSGGHK